VVNGSVQLDRSFAALAHPIRRGIVDRLANGPATVGEATGGFGVSKPAISKHLRVLERAGLIERGRRAQWRPRRLRARPLREVAEWIGQYRPHWEESFEKLDAFLRDLQDDRTTRKGPIDDRDQD
jgi:DNA-binding transcriptional ArsR family regulator